jgi:hypothetical protein
MSRMEHNFETVVLTWHVLQYSRFIFTLASVSRQSAYLETQLAPIDRASLSSMVSGDRDWLCLLDITQ